MNPEKRKKKDLIGRNLRETEHHYEAKAQIRDDETTKKPQSSESLRKHRINNMTENGHGRSHSPGVSNSTLKREAISGTGFAIKRNIFFS
jgi:hypothetical protein